MKMYYLGARNLRHLVYDREGLSTLKRIVVLRVRLMAPFLLTRCCFGDNRQHHVNSTPWLAARSWRVSCIFLQLDTNI